ncbi:hypothetical protein BGZ73_004915 [Actinomortierella ambigua]|nr:hypothetical protein BGZ73_004915 [Actinomortierella ambigua]
MSDIDDIWGSDESQSDNIDYERSIAEREWARMHENFGNEGYREGIEEGKDDETLQRGFDRGWQDGFRYGHELGKLRGLISPLIEYLESQPADADIKPFRTVADREQWIHEAKTMLHDLRKTEIENVYDKDYFDDKKPDGPVPISPPSPTSGTVDGDATPVAAANAKVSSGCCQSNGTGSLPNSGACQQGESSQDTLATAETESGCCQSKTGTRDTHGSSSGSCCQSKATVTAKTAPIVRASLSSAMADTVPEGSEYSRPEAVAKAFRDRAARLLQQANLGHLVVTRD